MFTDSVDKCISFVPSHSSKSNKSVKSSCMQTSKLAVSDHSAQATECLNQRIQTEPYEQNLEYVDTNMANLKAFLWNVEPKFNRIIQQNLRSRAFKHYLSNIPVDDDLLSHKFTLKQDLETENGAATLQPLQLSWNSSGTTLGVAYGEVSHDDWCTHKGYICTWNVERRTLNLNKADISLEMESCATVINFHPSTPSLLASGGFTGEVNIFNLTGDASSATMNTAHSRNHQHGHTQAVSGLSWLQKSSSQAIDLASCSYDGRVILWTIPDRGEDLVISRILMITVSTLPRALRGTVSSTGKETGISAFCFVHNEPNLFIAGGETGAVLHCSINSKDPLPSNADSQIPVYNPVVLALKPHKGPVYAIQTSKYHRNLFLTCGADGTARIYNMLKLDALLVLNVTSGAVTNVCWSPVRPTVFSCTTSDGNIIIYDLIYSESEALVKQEPNADTGASLHCIALNPTRFDVCACGHGNGTVSVWDLGERFSSILPNEQQVINSLAARVTSD